MPNVFGPELLFVGSIVSPFVLRVIISVSLFYLAFFVFKRLSGLKAQALGVLEVLLGVLVALGALTQLAALLSLVVFAWIAVHFNRLAHQPESRGFYVVLAILAFLLFLVGAGSVAAFDIPL